jgi:pilus assembly protein Flp/PilA
MTRIARFWSKLTRRARQLPSDKRGATAVEYGLLAALISLVILPTIFGIGNGLNTTLYGGIVAGLQSVANK